MVDAMLLAAGFGKRLRPLTDSTPKPLVHFAGKPIVAWHLERLAASGITRVIINVHYLGHLIQEFVGDGSHWGLSVEYSFEKVILDTGGGIKNVENFLRHDTLLTINADTALGTDFPLTSCISRHLSHPCKPIATMVLRPSELSATYGEIGIAQDGRVCKFLGREYFGNEQTRKLLMYTGVQLLSREVFSYMPPAGSVFSITRETYPALLTAGHYVDSFIYDGFWEDLGTPERLRLAENRFLDTIDSAKHRM